MFRLANRLTSHSHSRPRKSSAPLTKDHNASFSGDVAFHQVLVTSVSIQRSSPVRAARAKHTQGIKPSDRENKDGPYLVDHVRQQTLHLIVLQPPLLGPTAQPNRRPEFSNRNPRPAHRRRAFLLGHLEASGKENLPKQVPQRDVAAALEGQVDAALDELVLAGGEGGIEAGEIGASDAAAQGGEEGAETWVGA